VSGRPAASTVASSSPAPVPAGYTRVGGAAQGISLGVPASWVAIDLTKLTAAAAAAKISIGRTSSAGLVQDIKSLQKVHAVAVWDVKSAADTPQQFARNLTAYCFQGSGMGVGAAGLPDLKSAVSNAIASQQGTHVVQQDITIGGVPGLETSYQLTSSASGTFYGSQLEVVPKPDDACIVTESWGKGQSGGNVLSVAAATAEFL
jgi:hypothetical protein